MSCDRCGNATRPLAENNGEMLCDGCWKPEVLSWLEANREAIEAEVIKILLQRMMPVSSEIPEGANTGGRTVFYNPFKEVTDDS